MDRANWMSDNLPMLGSQPLRQISMPASHDAGMYALTNCTSLATIGANSCNTQTQTDTILQQLQSGIRYFDLRPIIYNTSLYTGHYDLNSGLGCNGPLLNDILTDVLTFMGMSRDLVILKFSHYYDRDAGVAGFSEAQMQLLCTLVTSRLANALYTEPVSAGGLSDVTINQYIGAGGKVLAVFDQLSDQVKNQFQGVYAYADAPASGDLVVFDQYSDTNELSTMVSDQLTKLKNPANHQNNLFLLSWTLTQSTAQVIACGAHLGTSILDLSDQANGVLWSNLSSEYRQGNITLTCLPNLLYVDNCGGFVVDVAMWLNTALLTTNSVEKGNPESELNS